jgi:hypothetical protein
MLNCISRLKFLLLQWSEGQDVESPGDLLNASRCPVETRRVRNKCSHLIPTIGRTVFKGWGTKHIHTHKHAHTNIHLHILTALISVVMLYSSGIQDNSQIWGVWMYPWRDCPQQGLMLQIQTYASKPGVLILVLVLSSCIVTQGHQGHLSSGSSAPVMSKCV